MNGHDVPAWLRAACLGVILTAHAGAAEPAIVRVERDNPYAADRADPGRMLDLHVPAGVGGKPRPTILFVHGGGWRLGDKEMVGAKPAAFAASGWAFASANYRLAETVSPREQAQDVADAIRWLHDHGPEHGCDPGRIVLLGHSAGAHLVALVSTDGRFLEARGLDLSAIAGTILLDGAGYDVPRQIEIARLPRMREMYRQVFTDDPRAQREASPITHVAAGKNIPPFLLFHVAARQDSREQAEALATRLRDAGGKAEVVSVDGKNHLTLNRELGEPGDGPTATIVEWLDGMAMRRAK